MHSSEIERRLRLPAPDEPRLLPALVLPSPIGDYGKVRARTGFRPSSSRAGFLPQRLVLAILALVVAMVAAIASGALRLDNPFDSSRPFGARGLTLTFPDDWEVVAALSPFNDQGQWTTLIVSNVGVDGCSADEVGTEAQPTPVLSGGVYIADGDDQTGKIFGMEDRIFACVVEAPMAPGEIRLVLLRGFPQRIGIGPIEPFDSGAWFGEGADLGFGGIHYLFPTEANGWTARIDGMPAKLVVETSSIVPGADEVRTWGVYAPEGGPDLWYVRATLRGPDLEELRLQADAIAQSIRFDSHPEPLDETTRDVALTRALDQIDRETREFRGSDLFGCFPRSAASADAMLDDVLNESGPYGRLSEAVPVTCTTSVERGALEKWLATLTLTWDGGNGYSAGERAWSITFDGAGALDTSAIPLGAPDAAGRYAFPGTVGPVPPPLDRPITLAPGALAEVLPPGMSYATAPIQAYFQQPSGTIGDSVIGDLPVGTIVLVVDGPLNHVGVDWYRVQLQHGASYGSEYTWLPVSDGIRPLLREVEPTCPASPTVDVIAYLHPAERLACFGDEELTLGPVMAELVDDQGNMDEATVTLGWLATWTSWRLYGAAGSDGLDAPLPFAVAPSLGDTIPTGTWLTVHGHFDDPAAEDCEVTYPPEWNVPSPDRELTVVDCRELFVITSFELRSAP